MVFQDKEYTLPKYLLNIFIFPSTGISLNMNKCVHFLEKKPTEQNSWTSHVFSRRTSTILLLYLSVLKRNKGSVMSDFSWYTKPVQIFLRWKVINDHVVFNTVSAFGVRQERVECWRFPEIMLTGKQNLWDFWWWNHWLLEWEVYFLQKQCLFENWFLVVMSLFSN